MAAVAELIAQGAERLGAGPHSERARADAELLLMHVLSRNKAWLLAHSDAVPDDQQVDVYIELVERRYRGEPIQYLTGETEFYGLPFKVTRDVLIPRPETEHLVERVGELLPCFAHPRIVDVGTGSGAIAIALAHLWPSVAIAAIDISAAALGVARCNAQSLGLADRIRFIEGDLLAPVAEDRFDIVVSNPPYVPNTDRALIAVEVKEYEPALALFAGEDGLDVYRRLIPAAYAVLDPGGFIALEIGFSQAEAITEVLAAGGFGGVEFTPDLQGIPRVVSAQRR